MSGHGMRSAAALAALVLVSAAPATGQEPISDRIDRQLYYTACAPLGLYAVVVDDDEEPIGLTEDRVRTMAESRLRAARLYTSDPARAVLVMAVIVFRNAYTYTVALTKRLTDELTGRSDLYPTTGTYPSIGTHGRNPGFMMQQLTESVDALVGDYLRVNAGNC